MDASVDIATIEKNGNKPEDWLDFIRKAKRESPKYEYLVGLYEKATSSISPDENRKNICYARLLVEFAKLQGLANAEDARDTFRIARCNVKRFAIVYIAWAQFELDKGNREKCRNHLRKGKTNRAEPSDILEMTLKNCDQGSDRLLDDETEELIFTGVVTQSAPRVSIIPLPTLMSDNDLTTEKLIGDDNTTDMPHSKSDTGAISFKLPQTNDTATKQRQKLSCSSSSGDDTVTAPFHHIVKPNRSMSTTKPSLKATPDYRKVGSRSLSNSMNLSVRKPNSRIGIGKTFNALMGPPLRGKPVQPLAEETESEEDNILDSFKLIEHTVSIPSENADANLPNIACTSSTNDENKKPKTENNLYSQHSLSSRNGATDIPECLPDNHFTKKKTNQDMELPRKSYANIVASSGILENPKVVNADSSNSHDEPMLPSSSNSDQVSNKHPIEKQIPISQSVSTSENSWLSNAGMNINNDFHVSKPDNGLSVQAVAKPKQPSYGAPIPGNHHEVGKPVDQVFPIISHSTFPGLPSQDGHSASSKSHAGVSSSSLASCQGQRLESSSSASPHYLNNAASNPIYPVNTINTHQDLPPRHMHAASKPLSSSSKLSNVPEHSRGAMGMDSYGYNDKNVLYSQCKNIPGIPGQFYPPPQGHAEYPKIVVNGKSYLKLGTIGRGGSSKVFRAFDGKRVCAVKYVSLEDADDFIVQSYINEIDMLKRLQGSDHIIKLYDWEQKKDENSIILVLECGSIDLSGFLRKNRNTFNETELKTYWQQMLEAVNVIHNEGIIHSDLKPANFLFVEGRLKLIDFGIANSIQADQTSIQRDTQVGTLNFMSPEAFQDISGPSQISSNTGRSRPCTKIGRPSDLWSLGCILYAMVYGRTPFQHITNQAMKLQCIIDESYAINFPAISNPKLLDVLKGCLIRNPRERYTIPHLLKHPFLSSSEKVKEPSEEQLYNALLELFQADVNSPRSIRVASQSICEQLTSGNKIDVSSIVAKKQRQAQNASRAGRQPLSGLSFDALQQGHSSIKSSTPYMGNDRPYLDKENADFPFT